MQNIEKKFFYSLILITLLFLLGFRDFLYTFKLMLLQSYNHKMLPFDEYYKIILYIDTGLEKYNIGWPWSSRIIPNYINFFFYKYTPCLEVNHIPSSLNTIEYCALWSLNIVNFLSLVLFQVIIFFYSLKILKRPLEECILSTFISYFVLSMSDRFGIDRISILFSTVFLFKKNTYLRCFFLILSIFFNEKITVFATSIFFCNDLIKFINKERVNFFFTFLGCGLFGLYVFFSSIFINSAHHHHLHNILFTNEIVSYNYFSFHGLSNTFIPFVVLFFPFFFYFKDKKIINLFKIHKIYLILIFTFFLMGIILGGPGNTGRYLIFTSPIFIPLLSYFLIKNVKITLNFYEQKK